MPPARPLRSIRDENIDDLKAWYPDDRWRTDPPAIDSFEIGLALAGGQSAGCYLAGVLDFLFEALDSWHTARRVDPTVPNHRVKLKIIVGASAGGLNAALAAVCARHRFAPASHVRFEDSERNTTSPFYRAWVADIDIANLLATDDLEDAGAPGSLLNSAYLDRKVASYLSFTGSGPSEREDRLWLEDPLPLKIMASNVDGVPYRIRFAADRAAGANAASHYMSLHRDYLAFQRLMWADAGAAAPPDHEVLRVENHAADGSWQQLGQAALATIAFPLFLQQRAVDRPSTDYDYRYAFPFAPGGLVYAPPYPDDEPQERRFTALDGGVLDNEPFELAHAALAGAAGRNKREGHLAKRAIILVDPFVSPPPAATGTSLLRFAVQVWNALVSQSRFKPIDLSLAEAEDIYSRFMIAPVRRVGDRTVRGDKALASSPLSSFFGYFARQYRHHDFMLGRHNCYKFLRDWLVLPSKHDGTNGPGAEGPEIGNGLFAGWPQAALDNPAYKSQSPYCSDHRQIIPLVGSAAQPPVQCEWPAGAFAGFPAIRAPLEARLDALYPRFRDGAIAMIGVPRIVRWLIKIGVGLYWSLSGRHRLITAIEDAVEKGRADIDGGG